MKKEDLKLVQGQIELSRDMYTYMKTSVSNGGYVDWDEINKQKVADGIVKEMLKNDLIEFETIDLPNGNVLIKGKTTIYKKSED